MSLGKKNLIQIFSFSTVLFDNMLIVKLIPSIFYQGFPGVSVLKNLPANAADGFDPWSQKIPLAAEQLYYGPQLLNLCS